ncbi:MAG: RHS repeat-associated core domain-containing protein [Thermoanaerobaculia bacterium]
MLKCFLFTFAIGAISPAAIAVEYFIPVVNGTVDQRRFTTTVEIQNPLSSDGTCAFEYRSPSRPEHSLVARERVLAGKTLVSEDFLGEIPTASTVRVRCSSPEIRVFSRINQAMEGEAFHAGWLFRMFSATPAPGGSTLSFPTTTDVVIAEVMGKQIDVAFAAKNQRGVTLAEKTYTLLPFGQRIVDLADIIAVMTEPTVELRVIAGAGALVASRETRDRGLGTVAERLSPEMRRRFQATEAHVAAAEVEARPSVTGLLLVSPFKAAPFREPATGQVYMRGRWYDPSTGPFVSPDPEGYRDSSNPYVFGKGDPVNNYDPTGRETISPSERNYIQCKTGVLTAGCADITKRPFYDTPAVPNHYDRPIIIRVPFDIQGPVTHLAQTLARDGAMRAVYEQGIRAIEAETRAKIAAGMDARRAFAWGVNARDQFMRGIRQETSPLAQVLADRMKPVSPNPDALIAKKGMEGAMSGLGRSNPGVSRWMVRSRIAGNTLIIASAGFSAAEIYRAAPTDRWRVVARESGSVLGSIGGGWAGMKGGAYLGSFTGTPVGTAVGGLVGGIGGAGVGGYLGWRSGDEVYEYMVP